MQKKCLLLLSVLLLGSIPFALSGVIRHDRLDQEYIDLAASSVYASVGRFSGINASSAFSASGTLIASDWVLTAAHVADGASSLDFLIGGRTISAAEMVIHSKWDGDLNKGFDIALVRLNESITDIAAASLYTNSDEAGLTATSVGFGRTGTGETGSVFFDAKKRAGNNIIDDIINDRRKNPGILTMDFDNPNNPGDNFSGSSTALDLEYLIAPGDSGGGLFVNVDGTDFLAGVHSFGASVDGLTDSDYGDISGHTRVSAFLDFINGVINPGTGGGKGGGKKGGGSDDGGGKKGGGRPFSLTAIEFADPIPEPSSFVTLAIGFLFFLRARRS